MLTLVLVESVTLALLAGGSASACAWLISLGGDPTGGFLPIFMFKPQDIALGVALAALVGLVGRRDAGGRRDASARSLTR